jgi:guanylate kinase
MPNITLLAYCSDVEAARESLRAVGGTLVHEGEETGSLGGRPIGPPDLAGPRAPAMNRYRTTYQGDQWRVTLERLLDRHDFAEIEIICPREEDLDHASSTLTRLRELLGIREIDVMPWSPDQVATIVASAELWRAKLGDLRGRLFLIDGPSGAGKSTLVHTLRDEARPGFVYVPRCTSRARRPGDEVTNEYIHLSLAEFETQVEEGRFLEYRRFMFNMSYGLRWDDVHAALGAPGTVAAFALVNLGNIRHVREFVPEATTILVTAPLDHIAARLQSRGTHTTQAIEERLHNALKVRDAAALSDHVIDNRDGSFEEALAQLRRVIGIPS